jgi:hypothetical protein
LQEKITALEGEKATMMARFAEQGEKQAALEREQVEINLKVNSLSLTVTKSKR